MFAVYIEFQICMNNYSYQGLLAFLINNYVLIDLVNDVTSLQVVNMVKLILTFLLLNVYAFNNVLSKNHFHSLQAITQIPSVHSVMEFIAQKDDGPTLCQKHSQIYLNVSSKPTGWAFQSKLFMNLDLIFKIGMFHQFGKKKKELAYHISVNSFRP